jgi:hypothetical protein
MTRFRRAKNGPSNFGETARLQEVPLEIEHVVTLSFGVYRWLVPVRFLIASSSGDWVLFLDNSCISDVSERWLSRYVFIPSFACRNEKFSRGIWITNFQRPEPFWGLRSVLLSKKTGVVGFEIIKRASHIFLEQNCGAGRFL